MEENGDVDGMGWFCVDYNRQARHTKLSSRSYFGLTERVLIFPLQPQE